MTLGCISVKSRSFDVKLLRFELYFFLRIILWKKCFSKFQIYAISANSFMIQLKLVPAYDLPI